MWPLIIGGVIIVIVGGLSHRNAQSCDCDDCNCDCDCDLKNGTCVSVKKVKKVADASSDTQMDRLEKRNKQVWQDRVRRGLAVAPRNMKRHGATYLDMLGWSSPKKEGERVSVLALHGPNGKPESPISRKVSNSIYKAYLEQLRVRGMVFSQVTHMARDNGYQKEVSDFLQHNLYRFNDYNRILIDRELLRMLRVSCVILPFDDQIKDILRLLHWSDAAHVFREMPRFRAYRFNY